MVIHIRDYPVFLKLGYYDQERKLGQDVLVSMEVVLVEGLEPGRRDDLGDTINYAELVTTVNELIRGREIKLVETIVELIGTTVLEKFTMAHSVKVEVEKRVLPQDLVRGARISVSKDFRRAHG